MDKERQAQDGQQMRADKRKGLWWQMPFLLLLIVGTIYVVRGGIGLPQTAQPGYQRNEGAVFGTIYHATYQHATDLQPEIEAELKKVDESLSMFNTESTISQINQDKSHETDSLLRYIFALSERVSEQTEGAFDITVAPLVNAWGFGYKNGVLPDSAQVDSLRALVGWQMIHLEADTIRKERAGMVMDCSAIAKGFGCDVVANMLRRKGIKNFMVEIGGEIVVEGKNDKGGAWRISVLKPVEDSTCVNQESQTVLQLTDCGMATSGNYRNYHVDQNGQKRAHTIDPRSGYPVQHSILSSTVIAPTCAEADAFATAFMVMGLDKAKETLAKRSDLKAYLIYADTEGKMKTYVTPNMPE